MKKYSPLKIFLISIVSVTAILLAKLLMFTCRVKMIRSKETEELENSDKPVIYAFWHGRLFPMSFIRSKHRTVSAVISHHLDGEMITRAISLLGIKSVRGSTNRAKTGGKTSKNRGGSRVIRESIKVLEDGESIAITPDGPKGPAFHFKRNFINVAGLTGAPIILVSFSSRHAKVFRSWDRFLLPMPFSTIKVKFSEPYFFPEEIEDEALENYGKELENKLNSLTAELDNEFNIKLN